MAFVGMKHVVAAPIKTEVAGQAVTYDTGVEIGAAISAKMQRLRKENRKAAIVAMHMMK